jgi:putative DNA primase/helicase
MASGPELEAFTKSSSSSAKAFLTRRTDRYRPPYGRHTIRQPRQCILAATLNPPAGGYLTDPTGARRIWPIACSDRIDLEALERDRDMLWAEALQRYKDGAKWPLETPELEALATAEQDLRFKLDPWHETVVAWIGTRNDTSLSEVLAQALGIEPKAQSKSAEMRVSAILTRLGFRRVRVGSGKRPWRYRRD